MTNITQITLTDPERALLADLILVASVFLANVHAGIQPDAYDASIVARCNDPDEIGALVLKLNADRIPR